MIVRNIVLTALLLAAAPCWSEDQVPQMVLWGTDLREISELEILPVPDDPTGTYRIELGGADVFLEITPAGDFWTVIRTYKAPGTEADVATYTAMRQEGSLKDSAHQLEIRAIPNALLVRETTGSDIPAADLWLIYDPT